MKKTIAILIFAALLLTPRARRAAASTITDCIVDPLWGPTNIQVTFIAQRTVFPSPFSTVSRRTIATDTSGCFSLVVGAGNYTVIFGPHLDQFPIIVPNDTNTYTLRSLLPGTQTLYTTADSTLNTYTADNNLYPTADNNTTH